MTPIVGSGGKDQMHRNKQKHSCLISILMFMYNVNVLKFSNPGQNIINWSIKGKTTEHVSFHNLGE